MRLMKKPIAEGISDKAKAEVVRALYDAADNFVQYYDADEPLDCSESSASDELSAVVARARAIGGQQFAQIIETMINTSKIQVLDAQYARAAKLSKRD